LAGEMSVLREALRVQMNDRVFPDIKQQSAYCDKKTTIEPDIDPQALELYPEPIFIIDGEVIDPAAPYTSSNGDDLKPEKFLMPAEAMAKYGKKAMFGAAILKSRNVKWPGGKPYRPLLDVFKKSFPESYVTPFPENAHFFLDGTPAPKEVFYSYNFY